MACLTSTTRDRIISRINTLEAQATTLETTITTQLENGIENYSFDSGEGKQSTKYRSLESLQKQLEKIESQIEKLYRRLNGLGIINLTMNRRKNDI